MSRGGFDAAILTAVPPSARNSCYARMRKRKGPAVLEVHQQLEGLADDVVRADSLDVGDEADAARVVFVSRSIESLVAWCLRRV